MPFTPEEVQKLLAASFNEGPEKWMAAVNTLLLEIVVEQAKIRKVIGEKLYPTIKKHSEIFDVLQAQFSGTPDAAAAEAPAGEAATPTAASSEPPMSAEQAATEAMMNQAAGPREGDAPTPVQGAPVPLAQRLRVPPKGGARGGAPPAAAPPVAIRGDGSDEDQAALEAMMNQAAGPRQ